MTLSRRFFLQSAGALATAFAERTAEPLHPSLVVGSGRLVTPLVPQAIQGALPQRQGVRREGETA